MIIVSGTFELEPESLAEALAAARVMAKATRQEPGCLAYAFYVDIENDSVVRVYEEWESPESLTRHFQTPHMAIFRTTLKGLQMRSRSVRRFEVRSITDL